MYGLTQRLRRLEQSLGVDDGPGGPDCPACDGHGPPPATIDADTDEQVEARRPRCPTCGVGGDLLIIARHVEGQPPPTGIAVMVLGPGVRMSDL